METRTRTRRTDRADVILDAAEQVLREAGAHSLTIDAVAGWAGLSKGGVLHHYASKDALIAALTSRKLARMREGIAAHERAGHERAGAQGCAGLPLAMIAHAREVYGEEEGFPRSLLLASAENPDALDGYRTFLSERLAALAGLEGREGAGAALIFALLGLMLSRSLGFHDLSCAQAARMFDALEHTARTLADDVTTHRDAP